MWWLSLLMLAPDDDVLHRKQPPTDTVQVVTAAAQGIRDFQGVRPAVFFVDGMDAHGQAIARRVGATPKTLEEGRQCRQTGTGCEVFDRARLLFGVSQVRIAGDSAFVVLAVNEAVTKDHSYRAERHAASRHQVELIRRDQKWIVVRHTLESVF
jgi:hypothetical protein